MNTAAKGRVNEHRFRDLLLAEGWVVIRAAGSFGVADLMALGPKVLMVNIKSNCYAPPVEREALEKAVTTLKKFLPVEAVLVNFCTGSKIPKVRVYSITQKKWVDVTHGYFKQ